MCRGRAAWPGRRRRPRFRAQLADGGWRGLADGGAGRAAPPTLPAFRQPPPFRHPVILMRIRRAAKWAGTILLWLALATLGALTGLRLAGPIDRDTAIGDIRLRIQASWHGQVDAYVPLADWGIRANAFSGPLTVRVEPRGVDRQALLRAAAGDREVLDRAESDARDAATTAVTRAVVFSGLCVLAASVLAALLRAALARNRPVPMRGVALWAG